MQAAIILNLDESVLPLPGARRIDLAAWQDTIRFGCSVRSLDRLETELDGKQLGSPRVAFLGSGDFHHLTYLLVRRRAAKRPFHVVVLDNHPDNMRYPWGIHCGSWVSHVCRLPFVSRVTVLGITSSDIRSYHLLENRLLPLLSGKLSYRCLSSTPRLARLMRLPVTEVRRGEGPGGGREGSPWSGLVAGLGGDPSLPPPGPILQALREAAPETDPTPIYLTIDKDVLSPGVVETNWDQGEMTEQDLLACVEYLKPRLLAADVTGEISFHRYRGLAKRLLSRLDGQATVPPANLRELRERHQRLNERLMSVFFS